MKKAAGSPLCGSGPQLKRGTMTDYICAEDYRDWIPDGFYEATCFNYNDKFCLGKSRKLFLNFKIVEPGKGNGVKLFKAYNMPYNKKVSTGSNYYKDWVMVNGWQKPSRNAKLSPRIFLNKVYRVKTRTVRQKRGDKVMPKAFQYSVVDYIVEVVLG